MMALWLSLGGLGLLAGGLFVGYMTGFKDGAEDGWRRGWKDRGEH